MTTTTTTPTTTNTTTPELIDVFDVCTRLSIADWRLEQIELYMDKSDEMEHEDIMQVCQQILELSADEIMEEYLS